MKVLKCLLTDSDVLLFIMNAMTIRFPEVPPATCAMLTIFIPYAEKNLCKYDRRQMFFHVLHQS